MDYRFEEIAPIRFGYGRRAEADPPKDAQGLLDQVVPGTAKPAGFVEGGSKNRIRKLHRLTLRQRKARKDKDAEATKAVKRERSTWLRTHYTDEAHRRVLWSVTQPDDFYERLAFFWADHFTVSIAKTSLRAVVSTYEVEAVRPFIAGDFRTLLRQAALHPVMQIYLDQIRSVGPGSRVGRKSGRGLNENLAREIIELHTLGVSGRYTQDDVRQFATLLTGVTVDLTTGETVFDGSLSEPGTATILGRTYGREPDGLQAVYEALDDLAGHPSTGRHLAWKLARHFLSDDPPEAVVQHLEATYYENDTKLMPLYRALLEHPASWETFGQKVRQPFDYLVASLRVAVPPGEVDEVTKPRFEAFETKEGMMSNDPMPGHYRFTLVPLRSMGQLPWSAPGPDGWPEDAAAWVSPQGLTERIALSTRLARGPLRQTEPEELLQTAFGPLSPDRVALLMKEASGPPEARALLLASPEFQRR